MRQNPLFPYYSRPAVAPIRGVHIFAGEVLLPLAFPKERIVVGQEVVCFYPLADTHAGRAGQSMVDYIRGRVTHILPGPWLLVDFPEQVRVPAFPLLTASDASAAARRPCRAGLFPRQTPPAGCATQRAPYTFCAQSTLTLTLTLAPTLALRVTRALRLTRALTLDGAGARTRGPAVMTTIDSYQT
eukprot:COSAG05_NODE_6634_length_927_cov_104.741546_1_plen_186_part_00